MSRHPDGIEISATPRANRLDPTGRGAPDRAQLCSWPRPWSAA